MIIFKKILPQLYNTNTLNIFSNKTFKLRLTIKTY